MDLPPPSRIRDDLRGVLRGTLLFDDVARSLYSTDASIFQVQPIGVVVPRDEADVQALVRYASEHHLPLIPRGAGTGLAGEALGTGLVLDFSQHFRSILDIGSDTVRLQPGVVLHTLNQELAPHGRRLAPDSGSARQCTLGGMLATNASGSRLVRHGYIRDHVLGLRAVLDSGDAVNVGLETRFPPPEGRLARLEDIIAATATLLEQHASLWPDALPRTPYNRCGYLLHDVLSTEHVHLAKLLVGSEGTLACLTEATLKTIPLPVGRSAVLLCFASLELALQAVAKVRQTPLAACELLDQRLLTLARGGESSSLALVPAGTQAVLLVEYEADSQAEANTLATDLALSLQRHERLAGHAAVGLEPEEIERVWGLREAALPSLYGLRGGAQPLPFVEDVGVPPDELPNFLRRLQEILKHHETIASYLVHGATGQVHVRPFLDLQSPSDVAKIAPLAEEIFSLTLELGGTVSSQHGTGIARTPWVSRQFGRLADVFRAVKTIFDPGHIFNPGKIVGSGIPATGWPLRSVKLTTIPTPPPTPEAKTAPAEADSWHLHWQPNEALAEVLECSGCGHCRTTANQERMCPIFRAQPSEAATPRAKANLLRHLFTGQLEAKKISTDEVREVADLCVNCKMCARECPSHVNIPKLMLEAKAANVAEHGLSRGDWALARAEGLAWLGSTFAPLVNLALRSPWLRVLLEKTLGVSRQRRLPRFSARTFLHRARRLGWTKFPRASRQKVAYFVDVFANYNDPSLAEATVRVLHHHGIEVYVPAGQRGCGMAPLAQGDVESARDALQHNLRLFAEVAREGVPILCSEPTAAVLLKQDSLALLDDPDVKLVAERIVELTAFLEDLYDQGRLKPGLNPLPISVGHHVPCHIKALGRPPAGPKLLSLIPQLRLQLLDLSCSGMAGTFGLKAANRALSLQAGQPMLSAFDQPRVMFGSTECSTCRLQMEDCVGKRTLHPIQYLALAYGLMPEFRARLLEPIDKLVL